MRQRRMAHTCVLPLCVLLMTNGTLLAQNQRGWVHRSRVQLGVEYDDNIKETRSNPLSAPSMLIMFHYTGRRAYSAVGHVQLSYRGGYQGYWNHPDENKLINDISGEATRSLAPGWCLGVQARGRLKFFLNNNIDYYIGNASIYSILNLPAQLSSTLTLTYESLDYALERMFDFSGAYARLSFERAFGRWIMLSLFSNYQRRVFGRMAFDYSPESGMWSAQAPEQVDNTGCLGLQIECRRVILLYLTYTYESNISNSYGFDFDRHRLQALLGSNLCAGVMLRIYAALQRKRYSDDLGPFFPLELDTEREESNFLIVDLSRDIGALSLILRTALYDNESPIRELYYSKLTSSLSFEFKF